MDKIQIVLLAAAAILFVTGVLIFINVRQKGKKSSKKTKTGERVKSIIATTVGVCSILTFLFAQFAVTGEPAFRDIYYNYDDHSVNGSVSNMGSVNSYRVALFIYTREGWQAITPDLSGDESGLYKVGWSTASFSINAYRPQHFEADIQATKYTVFLIPASEASGELTSYNAVNRISIHRSEQELEGTELAQPPTESTAPSSEPTVSHSTPSPSEPTLGEIFYDPVKKAVSGTVLGVESTEEYRVALMIYTDDWYIKPSYSVSDPGASLSAIEKGGSYTINAYRLYPSELTDEVVKVAVFLIPAEYTGPTRQNDYHGLSSACIDSRELDV